MDLKLETPPERLARFDVIISPQDRALVEERAMEKRRFAQNMRSHKISERTEEQIQVDGELPEFAVCKALQLPYENTNGRFKDYADIGDGIDVRAAYCHNWKDNFWHDTPCIPIGRPGDVLTSDRIWVGCFVHPSRTRVIILGCMRGNEVKDYKRGRPSQFGPEVHMVPHHEFHPILLLFGLLHPKQLANYQRLLENHKPWLGPCDPACGPGFFLRIN